MNSIAVALLLALPSHPVSSKDDDTYGKSEAQILSMGRTAWYDFYTHKAGESTYAMSNAYGIYGDLAEKRNQRALTSGKYPHSDRVNRISKLLIEFGSEMVSLGSSITGGGTMWGPIGSSTYAQAQDVTYDLLTGKYAHAEPQGDLKQVSKLLSQVPKLLYDNQEILTEAQKHQAKTDAHDATQTLSSLQQAMKVCPLWQKRICYGFALECAKLLSIAGP
jgi:hypothetical protein